MTNTSVEIYEELCVLSCLVGLGSMKPFKGCRYVGSPHILLGDGIIGFLVVNF